MAVNENVVNDGETSTSASSTPNLEASDALYIHPSDSPGMMLVPTQFDGMRYRSLRRGVLPDLSVKNKLGFIDVVVRNQIQIRLNFVNGKDAMIW